MALFVPDGVRIYEADMDTIARSLNGDGVLSGGAISAQGSPNMSVNVAAGEMRMGGTRNNISTAANPIAVAASDPTNPRVDLVRLQSNGTPSIVTGTPASTPKPPALTAGFLLLGYISVSAAAVNIQNSNITQRQIISGGGMMQGTLAARPAATGVPAGTPYVVSDGIDGLTLYYSNAVTWTQIAAGSLPTTISQPNLLLNSDFGRRTVFGLAMPEVFADLNGTVKIDGGAAGSVAANIFTQGAANNEYGWCNQAFVWRDGRASATFKAVTALGIYLLRWRISATDWIQVDNEGGTFTIRKNIANTNSVIASNAQALTLNNWYWLEIEKQGTTIIAKIYNTGGTASGVAKASSTLLQTLTATVSDASVQVGAHVSISSDQAAAQWGGQAASPGGVYVETWLPESWALTHTGTLGGQAVGLDESADSGPLGKQGTLRVYVPAASRTMSFNQGNSARGNANPSTTYARSLYYKVSGIGGSGALATLYTVETDGAGADVTVGSTIDTGNATSWTRATDLRTTAASARGWRPALNINVSSTATGTIFIMLIQLEQGSAATAWRNAPADDAPIVWTLIPDYFAAPDPSTTSVTFVEVESSRYAANIFIPWDAKVTVEYTGIWYNSTAGSQNMMGLSRDGADVGSAGQIVITAGVANARSNPALRNTIAVTAGKHRYAMLWRVSANTATIERSSWFQAIKITAYRGI